MPSTALFNADVEAGLDSSLVRSTKNDGLSLSLSPEQDRLLGEDSTAVSEVKIVPYNSKNKPKSAMGSRVAPRQGIMRTAFSDNNNGSLPRNVLLSESSAEGGSLGGSLPTSPVDEGPLISGNLKRGMIFNGANLDVKYATIPTTSPSKNNTLTSTDSKLRNKISSKYGRYRKRVVFKNGDINLNQTNISKRKRRYLADIFTTLVDIQWRWTLLLFMLSFILSWLFFAMIWWLISFIHGDLEFEHLPDQQEASGWKPCVNNMFGFTSAFLFSIETQHTIGYGSRYTTEECTVAITCMCLQSILGVMIQHPHKSYKEQYGLSIMNYLMNMK